MNSEREHIDVLHVFNANQIGGPEKATLPGLGLLGKRGLHGAALFLTERRLNPPRMEDIKAYANACSVDIDSIEVFRRYDRAAIRTLSGTVRIRRTRLVHCHGNKATIYGILAARGTGAKVISTQHGFIKKAGVSRLYNLLYLAYAKHLKVVLAVSSHQAQDLRSQLRRLGIRTPVIPLLNSAPLPQEGEANLAAVRLSPVLRNSSWKANEPPQRPWACQVARLSREKNHETVLKAIARLSPSTAFTHWIFGEGPEERRLKGLVDRLGIGNRVIFCGYVSDVECLLPQFDALIMASSREALPMAAIEAAVRGIPVITTDIPGMREILPDGEHALFVAAGNVAEMQQGLDQFLTSMDGRLKAMGSRARERALEHFSLKRWCSEIHDVYRTLLP